MFIIEYVKTYSPPSKVTIHLSDPQPEVVGCCAIAPIGVNLREEVPMFVDEEPLSLDVADVQL
jgi:hypothetical protein